MRNIQLDINPFIDGDDDISGDDFLLAAYKDFQYEGRQIGFPRETTSTIIIYNAEMFDAAGMPRPSDGWTWTDFVDCATAMTQGEGRRSHLRHSRLATESQTRGSRCGRRAAMC